jgi:hypothetical protein
MKRYNYKVDAGFTLDEMIMARAALLECVRRWWRMRHSVYMRGNIREAVAVYRKLRGASYEEVAR